MNPLLTASYNGYREIVELLIKGKANLNVTDKFGSTPLSNAVETDNAKIVELLLDNGAGIKCEGNVSILNYKDKNGKEYIRVLQDIKISAPPSQSLSVSSVDQVVSAKSLSK